MINGNVYRSMIVSAANNIANLQDEINKLNVFPVPDGDTGTNMSLTMQAGKNAVDNFNGGLTECADKVASALLRSLSLPGTGCGGGDRLHRRGSGRQTDRPVRVAQLSAAGHGQVPDRRGHENA